MMHVSPARLVLTEVRGNGVTVYTYRDLDAALVDMITNRGSEIPKRALAIAQSAVAVWEAAARREAEGDVPGGGEDDES